MSAPAERQSAAGTESFWHRPLAQIISTSVWACGMALLFNFLVFPGIDGAGQTFAAQALAYGLMVIPLLVFRWKTTARGWLAWPQLVIGAAFLIAAISYTSILSQPAIGALVLPVARMSITATMEELVFRGFSLRENAPD